VSHSPDASSKAPLCYFVHSPGKCIAPRRASRRWRGLDCYICVGAGVESFGLCFADGVKPMLDSFCCIHWSSLSFLPLLPAILALLFGKGLCSCLLSECCSVQSGQPLRPRFVVRCCREIRGAGPACPHRSRTGQDPNTVWSHECAASRGSSNQTCAAHRMCSVKSPHVW